MLKQRLITAIVMMAVFLAALVYLPTPLFAAFIATVVLIGAWEWANLAGLSALWQRVVYVAVMALVLAFGSVYLQVSKLEAPLNEQTLHTFKILLTLACTWWALALLWVQTYPQSALLWRSRTVRALMGFLVLAPAWVGLVYLRAQDNGIGLLLLLIATVICADTGGYFAGRRWGKTKLAPAVSPGKTWEGVAGGVAANIILSLVIWSIWGGSFVLLLAIVIPTALVSILGDLQESMLKRHRGIKDSSALLPGHGGLLDRVDSLTAAAPVFALAVLVSGWMPG